MNSVPIVRVALPTPLRRLFDYRAGLSDALSGAIEPGMRVRVPFGRQRLIGVAVQMASGSELPEERLKSVLERLDPQPIFDPATLGLLAWAADYYHHPIGEVLTAALPKALRLGAAIDSAEVRWRITPEGHAAWAQGEPRRAPRQRQLLTLLAAAGPSEEVSLAAADLDEKLQSWRAAARALIARGWLLAEERVAPTAHAGPPALPGAGRAGPEPNEEQRLAIERVCDSLGAFGGFVLHGVTGSGKTEVYLRIVERVLRLGRSALVLVPEIGLTPQLVGRFRERFELPMAVLHSGLTDHERLLAWRDAFSGRARIVLGTRSAVFAPM